MTCRLHIDPEARRRELTEPPHDTGGALARGAALVVWVWGFIVFGIIGAWWL